MKRSEAIKKIRRRIKRVIDGAKSYCVGREQASITEMLAYATLSKEHVCLIGPPGCNKSQSIDYWTQHLTREEHATFRVTLSKESSPETIIGPFDPRALKERGAWVRNLENTIADERVKFAHISEIFSARGSTLRELVRILNEREIENGGRRIKLNLQTVFADSNYFPPEENDAVFDRFLFRAEIGYLPTSDRKTFAAMVASSDMCASSQNGVPHIGCNALEIARDDIEKRVEIPDAVVHEVFGLRADMASPSKSGSMISDRRWKRSIHALRAVAWCRDSYKVDLRDLYALRFTLFDGTNANELKDRLEQYKHVEPEEHDEEYIAQCENIYTHAIESGDGGIIANAIAQLEETRTQLAADTSRSKIDVWVDTLTGRMTV